MSFEDEVRREINGKPERAERPAGNHRNRQKSAPRRTGNFNRTKAPLASERASGVAQRWMNAAEARGMEVPFNANWLAHQISTKVVRDPEFRSLLQKQRHADVVRWLEKMVDKFWEEYVDNSVSTRDVGTVFLSEIWDDLRAYAYDCLRAAYLKQHGVPVPAPEPVNHLEDPMHQALAEIHRKAALESIIEAEERPAPKKTLDERRRQMLSSARRKTQGARRPK